MEVMIISADGELKGEFVCEDSGAGAVFQYRAAGWEVLVHFDGQGHAQGAEPLAYWVQSVSRCVDD